MELDRALELALDGEALLFVGAGFSVGALNLNRHSMKTADGLSKHLCRLMELPDDTGLEDAAEEHATYKGDSNLIELLHREFSASEVDESHRLIADIPWRRIYTTNYDNVMETAYAKSGKRLNPVTPAAEFRKTPKDGTLCVHLNGFIDHLDSDTLWGEFKLTDTSYASQSLVDSPWVAAFRQDLRLASVVFFVGYKLSDLDIKRILFESDTLREKTFFFLPSGVDKPAGRRLTRYGQVIPKTTKDFADLLVAKSASHQKSLRPRTVGYSLEEYIPPKAIGDIGDIDAFRLFTIGDFRTDLAWDSLNSGASYLVLRREASRILGQLQPNRVLAIHAELGNGKTILLEQIKISARMAGMAVYSLSRFSEDSIRELELLEVSRSQRTLLVIDDYSRWLDECEYLGRNWKEGLSLLVSARSSSHDVLVDRLVEAFNGREILEISANRLTEDECKALVAIYDNYGLWGERAAKSVEEKIRFVRNTCHSEFSAILLATLNSPQILGRYNLILDDLQQRRGFHKVLVSILILTVLQYPATTDTLLDIWGEQILNPRFRQDSAVRQLCNVRSGLFIMRSSVAARYLLQNMGNSRVIVDVLVTMAKQCSRLSQSSKQYYELLRQLMLFSNLTTFTPPAERRSLIVSFYESVRTLPQTRTNPQFWLQYAIAALVFEDMDRAKVYFKDAYSYASKRDGYDTTYIDNQYARYLLSYVVQNHLEPNYMIIFREARDLLLPQMKGERLHYPYRVASSFADFYNTFESKFSSEEKQEIRNTATRVLESIASLPADKQTHKYVTRCYENMTYLTEMLSSPTS